MPSADVVIWTTISGLILVMLGIIGYLVKTGFEGVKNELKLLWQEFKDHRKENDSLRNEHADFKTWAKSEIARIDERCRGCEQGHMHKRITDGGQ